jgi:hypothetical protein
MRISLLAAVIAASFLRPAVAAEWIAEVHYGDRAALARVARQFQHVKVDRQRAVLRVQVDDRGISRLQADGLVVGIDMEASANLQALLARAEESRRSGLPVVGPNGYEGIDGFPCYRTVEGTYETMDDLATDHPGIVEIHEIGPSWLKEQSPTDGYEMRALRITNLATAADDPDRPAMVAFGSIHAREYAPAEITTRFAEWLVQNYGTDPEATWLVDHNDFRLVLQANPDGRKIAEEQVYWRKNVNDVDGQCTEFWGDDGIDLNRNFPFHWNITLGVGSGGNACDETFRGPQPQSEPETMNLVSYVAGTCNAAGECSGGVFADRRTGTTAPAALPDDGGAAPDDTSGVFFDIHSYAELVLWSWGDTSAPAPNRDGLRRLGRRLAAYNLYEPQQADELYPTDGTTDDTIYGLLGVPAYTFETDGEFFQACGGTQGFEARTLQKNLNALRYAARAMHAPYRLPGGPDARSIVTSGLVEGETGWSVSVQATIDDTHYRQSNGTEATYAIVGAKAWVDGQPWEAAPDATALTASDGAFNATSEQVEGTIELSGIAPGRHLLYVQGVNARGGGAGTVGTPNAVFIEVPEFDDTIFENGFETQAR